MIKVIFEDIGIMIILFGLLPFLFSFVRFKRGNLTVLPSWLIFLLFLVIADVFVRFIAFTVFDDLLVSPIGALSLLSSFLIFFSIIISIMFSSSWKEYSFLGASEFELLTLHSAVARVIRSSSFKISLLYLATFPLVVSQIPKKFLGNLVSMWGAVLIVVVFALFIVTLSWLAYLWERALWGSYDTQWRDFRFAKIRMRTITLNCQHSIQRSSFRWNFENLLLSAEREKEVTACFDGSSLRKVLDTKMRWWRIVEFFLKKEILKKDYFLAERFVKTKWSAEVVQLSCKKLGVEETWNYFVEDIYSLAGMSGWRERSWDERVCQLQERHSGWFPRADKRVSRLEISFRSSWVLAVIRQFFDSAEKNNELEDYICFCCDVVEWWSGEYCWVSTPESFHPDLVQEISYLFFRSVLKCRYAEISSSEYGKIIKRIERSDDCAKLFWFSPDEHYQSIGGRQPTDLLNEALVHHSNPSSGMWSVFVSSLSDYSIAAVVLARLCLCRNSDGTCHCGLMIKNVKKFHPYLKVWINANEFEDAIQKCIEDDHYAPDSWCDRALKLLSDMNEVRGFQSVTIDLYGLDIDYVHYVHFLHIVENTFCLNQQFYSDTCLFPSNVMVKWSQAFDTFMASPLFTLHSSSSESAYYRDARKSLDRIREAL